MKKLLFALSLCALCASVSPLPAQAEPSFPNDYPEVKTAAPEARETVSPVPKGQTADNVSASGGGNTEAVQLRENGREAFKKKDYAAAVKYYRQAADMGDAEAQFLLGNRYYTGQGVNTDKEQAFYWYQKAAEQGYADAQVLLGQCYLNGDGTAQDEDKGFYWLNLAVEHDSSIAKLTLGLCYMSGSGVAQDLQHGCALIKEAAEQGDAASQLYLGCFCCEGAGVEQNIEAGKKWFAQAAASTDEGDELVVACAKEILAELKKIDAYLDEAVELQELERAFIREQKSDDKETIAVVREGLKSINELIDYLQNARQNFPRLITAAVHDGNEKAAQDLKNARQNLISSRNATKKLLNLFKSEASGEIRVPADIYTNTKQYDNLKPYDAFTKGKQACSKGDPQGYALWESSARRGCNQAKLCLAYSLLPAKHKLNKGDWASFVFEGKELSEAERLQRYLKWMGSAADNGSLTACQELRQVYKEGTYAPKDSAKVFHYTKAAAQLKDPDAMFDLGTRYAAGIGCQKDRAAAVKWIKQAAHAGNADAQQWIDDRRGRYVENTQSYRINPYQAFQEALRKYPQAYSVTEFYHSSGRTSSDLCIGIVNGERDGYTDIVDTPDISHVPGRYVLIPGRCRWNRGDIVIFYGYSRSGTDDVRLIDDCTRTRTIRKWQGPKVSGWEDLL